MWPTIPLPAGDRIVSIKTHNALTNEPERRVTRDFPNGEGCGHRRVIPVIAA